MPALDVYRRSCTPSAPLDAPYVRVGLNVFAASTDAEARYLQSSAQQSLLSVRRGHPIRLPPPVEHFEDQLTVAERALLAHAHACSVAGAPETVRHG